jgi:RNA polymerase sigma factor, sigma-70 family
MIYVKNKDGFIDALENGGMFESLFGYAYKRCYSREEAEDLCQEIITEILQSLDANTDKTEDAYIWKIAHNTYVNHVDREARKNMRYVPLPDVQNINVGFDIAGPEETVVTKITDDENLAKIKRSIASLSEIYRDVMIMYYFNEMKIAEIARALDIPENRVKQRLFSAKEKIRKEVTIMPNVSADKNIAKETKYYTLTLPGTPGSGSVFDEHSRETVMTPLRQNILIACRKDAKSVKELSKELKVPEIFLGSEVRAISADLLTKNADGKYIANSIVITPEIDGLIDKMMAESAAEFIGEIRDFFTAKKDEFMSLEYLNAPSSYEFLLWYLIPRFTHTLTYTLRAAIVEKMTANGIEKEDRGFYVVPKMEEVGKNTFYKGTNDNGITGVTQTDNKAVSVHNISIYPFIPWESGRFPCARDFTAYQDVWMIIKTVGGLDESAVDKKDKEAIAAALAKGYIRKESGKLYPNVVVSTAAAYEDIDSILWSDDAQAIANKFISQITDKYWDIITAHIPPHLHGQSDIFAGITAGSIAYYIINESIKSNLLYQITQLPCAEAIFGTIEK